MLVASTARDFEGSVMDAHLINRIAQELRVMSGAYPVAFSAQAECIAEIVEDSDWFSDQKHQAYLDGDRDGYQEAAYARSSDDT